MNRAMSLLRCGVLSAGLLAPLEALAQDPIAGFELFSDSSKCIACHSNIHDADGDDISIGYTWRASMMANAGRDPYWLASVRREVTDHPQAQAAIEDKCATCHIPAARFSARQQGSLGTIFEHYRDTPPDPQMAELARDGVTCTVCHQITPEGLGTPGSFTGGFHIDVSQPTGQRDVFGPHDIDAGRARVMNSASSFLPQEANHLAKSEVCATCHTLYTSALDGDGNEAGELPEQVPYLEWKHSAFRETRSCQDCHMPVVKGDAPITSVLGEPRPQVSRHVFRGGNVFMLRLLSTYRDELGVKAPSEELQAIAHQTEEYLGAYAATIAIESLERSGDTLDVTVALTNEAGHKLPTGYPSRRAWLHVTVTDGSGSVVFESGRMSPDGSITGNDNDVDGGRYEPHYELIESPDQVQIYEPVMVDYGGRVTTGLIYGVRYIKDNRLLPDGFDKTTSSPDVAVHGGAADDADFRAGGDRIVYRVPIGTGGSLTVTATLLYQSIAHRWAENLAAYDAPETEQFVHMYRTAAADSAVTLATATRTAEQGARQ